MKCLACKHAKTILDDDGTHTFCSLDTPCDNHHLFEPLDNPTDFVAEMVVEADSALNEQEGGDHYKKYKIQPIEFCYHNKIPAIEASIIKYVTRHRDKNGIEDVNKAIHLLEILKELEYGS